MAKFLVHHKVEDFNKWKPFFEQHSDFRAQNGSKGGKVFRNSDNPNDLFILFEWDSSANAKKFAQSDSLREIMQKAGVQGMPEVHFIEEAFSTKN
jgi:heme-degrading monooxygenase HmoA